MKVIHAAETIQGGIATVLKQLAIWQAASDEYRSVKCLIPDSQSDQINPLPEKNKVHFKRSGRNIASLLSFCWGLVKLVAKEKPDVVHFHSTFAGFLGRLILIFMYPFYRPKVVYCPHAFAFLMSNKSQSYQRFYSLIEKLFLKVTDKVICVSDYERDKGIEAGLSADKLVTIHNGVRERNPSLSAEKNPFDPDKINILFIGRFDYQKGYDLLLQSMRELQDPRFHLTSIGSGVLSDYQCETEANITYTGWIASADIEPWLAFADMLVIPSRWEGFAMVPLEAMNFALPVIASNTTSLPEVVVDNVTGILFDIAAPGTLTEAIKSYDKDKFTQMGLAGNSKFMRCFTADKMITNTHQLYQELLGKRAVPLTSKAE